MGSLIRALFTRHLLLANTLTCGIQGATGDILEQLVTGKLFEIGWNYHQTAIMLGCKLAIGPPLHLFYYILDGTKFKGNRHQVNFKKLFWDTVFNPCFSFSIVTSAALLEGESVKVSIHDYREKFFDYIKIDFILWPACQLINFYFVPHHYRVLFVSAIALVDCTLLSLIRKRQNKLD